MKRCFIISPIGEENSDIRKRSDQLLKHIIQPACEAENIECTRIDQVSGSDTITDSILTELQTADLVIADLTDHNPNCFYELGYRAALEKPLIQMKNHSTPIPFDISAIRTIDYDLNDLDKVVTTKEKLQETIHSFKFDTAENTTKEHTTDNNIQTTANDKLDTIQQTLFHISDKIDRIKPDVESGVVSVLADKLQATGKKTPEEILFEQLMPLLLSNPSQMRNVIRNLQQLNELNN